MINLFIIIVIIKNLTISQIQLSSPAIELELGTLWPLFLCKCTSTVVSNNNNTKYVGQAMTYFLAFTQTKIDYRVNYCKMIDYHMIPFVMENYIKFSF